MKTRLKAPARHRARCRPVGFYFAAAALTAALSCPAAAPGDYRAARSVHLGYTAPPGQLFYNEVVVEQSVNGSYFMACGWDTGYFGIQQLSGPTNKVVLFSVWDPTKGDNPEAVKSDDRVEVLYAGDGVRIKRFGGEGTGGQCMWRHAWQTGETNRFVVEAAMEGQKTSYTAWFGRGDEASWRKLATFRTRTGGRGLNGYYSFIEDFRRDGQSVHEERRARFGIGWVKTMDGRWVPLNAARFTASNATWESPDNIDAGIAGESFYLATGGELKRNRELRSLIELPPSHAAPPKWLVEFPVSTQ